MSPILNTQFATPMDIAYSDAISVAMNHPPLEAGAYGVKYFDGSTGSEVWDGENWIGSTNVARYSGRPFLLTKGEKKHHVDIILAAVTAGEKSDRNKIAAASALALARHYASKVEKNRTGSKVGIHIQNMLGFYLLARNLGMNFEPDDSSTIASITDKKLLAWAYQEIARKDCDRIEEIVRGRSKRGSELHAWLIDILA